MNSRQWHDKFPKNRKAPLYEKKPLWQKTIVSFTVTITSHIIQDNHIINFKWKHSKSHLKYYFLPQITLEAWVMSCVCVHSYSTQKCKVYVTKNVLDRKSSLLYFLHCVFCILFYLIMNVVVVVFVGYSYGFFHSWRKIQEDYCLKLWLMKNFGSEIVERIDCFEKCVQGTTIEKVVPHAI